MHDPRDWNDDDQISAVCIKCGNVFWGSQERMLCAVCTEPFWQRVVSWVRGWWEKS